jgi:hypothetical protein
MVRKTLASSSSAGWSEGQKVIPDHKINGQQSFFSSATVSGA